MRFRPCIDLHDGAVKQIVGSTLRDGATGAASLVTNFVAAEPAAHFAGLYRRDGLPGGHVIMLGGGAANEAAALAAVRAFPGGLQVGGGINPDNALRFLDAGASHVIVTSHVFAAGKLDWGRLEALAALVGPHRLVLDVSCRKRAVAGGAAAAEPVGGGAAAAGAAPAAPTAFEYIVMTDRWQVWSDVAVTPALLRSLAPHCAELLVHAVDVEGKRSGVEGDLVALLGAHACGPVTYAGGVRHLQDVERVRELGGGRVDVSIGSALDIFGGDLPYAALVEWQGQQTAAAPGTA